MLKLWYEVEHDAVIHWCWIDYIKQQKTLKRTFFRNHSESYFEVT